MTINYIKPTEDHAKRLLELLPLGLVKGLGKSVPGKMCAEALVCHVFGLPHGDKPPCVGIEPNRLKISINDKEWSSPFVRAEGMKKLLIAQLGSVELDQQQFRDNIFLAFGQKISPLIFRYHATKTKENQMLLKQAENLEKAKTLNAVLKLQQNYAYGYGYGYAHSYDYAYGYGYDYGYDYDIWLKKVCDVVLQVFIDMKSPGCQWLHLCK